MKNGNCYFCVQMHIAAANGYDEVVEYLLDHGAKISMVDHDAWQPIHAAACWGHVSAQQPFNCFCI